MTTNFTALADSDVAADDSIGVEAGDTTLSVDQVIEQGNREAEAAYRQLVFDLADVRQFDKSKWREWRATIAAVDKSSDDLKRHAVRVAERRHALSSKAKADELSKTLPDLQAKCDETSAAIQAVRIRHQKELQPLIGSAQQAESEFKDCSTTISRLRRDAAHILSSTVGSEFMATFNSLSNRACMLEQQIREARQEAAMAKQKLPAAEKQITEFEGIVMREESKEHPSEALLAKLNSQLAGARERHAKLLSADDTIKDLKAKKIEADKALAEYADNGVNDSRSINWD
jgi:chromosome segregation ATPase